MMPTTIAQVGRVVTTMARVARYSAVSDCS
jgi:hypothetical protein